jgi:hypothetical protein
MQRSKAFSGKKKRVQLLEKRQKKKEKQQNEEDLQKQAHSTETTESEDSDSEDSVSNERDKTVVHNYYDKGKDLRTVFEKESQGEVEKRKTESWKALNIEKRNQVGYLSKSSTNATLI